MKQLYTFIQSSSKFLAGGRDCGYGGDSMSAQSAGGCKAKLESMCSPSPVFGQWYTVNYNYIPAPHYGVEAPNALLDVAYFLLSRAPYAWIAGGSMPEFVQDGEGLQSRRAGGNPAWSTGGLASAGYSWRFHRSV